MTQRRILVADDLGAEGLAILEQAADVTVQTGMDEAQLAAALAGIDALVVRSATTVTARALEGADRLVLIGRAGIGVDNIDVPAATARGIVVMNTPDAGATTTAEHAIALLVSLARKIPAADARLKAGGWDKKRFTGVELTNKVLGVIGLGRIGSIVADRGRGLAMEVVAYDPFVSQDRAPAGVRMLELDELLGMADFLTVHVPMLDETRHLLNAERFANVKPGARLVHAARGGIVDETALLDALESGRLAGAALDVFEAEPLADDHPLRSRDDVVLTPHIGASTEEAKRSVALDMANQIAQCLTTGIVLNGVNVPRVTPAEAATVGPFLDLTHNLASVLAQVFDGGPVQSVRVSLQGGLAAAAAEPLTTAALVGALHSRIDRPVTPVNARQIADEIGCRVHVETSTLKRDFMNLVRVEVVIDEQRHYATGTVLGHRHGRMVELDDWLIDAIPEGPLLVTYHRDVPGVLGGVGSLLGERGINVDRMQLGEPLDDGGPALGVWNLDRPLESADLAAVEALDVVDRVHLVR